MNRERRQYERESAPVRPPRPERERRKPDEPYDEIPCPTCGSASYPHNGNGRRKCAAATCARFWTAPGYENVRRRRDPR